MGHCTTHLTAGVVVGERPLSLLEALYSSVFAAVARESLIAALQLLRARVGSHEYRMRTTVTFLFPFLVFVSQNEASQ